LYYDRINKENPFMVDEKWIPVGSNV
jgi:hypothetical protein